jgi:hypothetical protein
MDTINIIKSTLKEQRQNSRLTSYFLHAFNGCNSDAIKEMLHDEGVFLGKYSKERMAGIFYTIFFGKEYTDYNFHHSRINKGIALDKIPGAEVIEIRMSENERSNSKLGDPANPEYKERVYRFCFRFQDDLIIDIQIPTLFMENNEILAELN